MEQKEQDKGISQYKGFIKLLIKIVVPILLLVLLYLAYTPVDPEAGSTELPPDLKARDLWLLPAVALLFLVALFFDCNKQFISRVASIIKEHWPRMLILFLLIVGGLTTLIITFHIGPRFSIDVVLARLSSSDEIVNFKSIALGLAGIIGVILAGWRSSVAERQARVAEERRLEEREVEKRDAGRRFDERFANAVKFLSTELDATSYPAHLGAIAALRDLAVDNDKYTQSCLDILCSFNQWMDGYLEEFSDNNHDDCYAIRSLTDNQRIIPIEKRIASPIKLEQERRSQQALVAIAYAIKKISNDDTKKHILEDLDLSGRMMCGIDLSKVKIGGINLKNAHLNGAELGYANLQKAKLSYAELRGANLEKANLYRSNLRGANLQKANLEEANLEMARLLQSNLQGADLSIANMQRATLYFANLQGANLIGAQISGGLLLNVKMQGANLTDTNLQGARCTRSRMQGTDLTDANLQGADLTDANLQGADLRRSQLQGAIFCGANLQGTILNDANLQGSIFLRCNLYGADIQNNNFANVMYGDITDSGYIKDKQERQEWIKRIQDNFYSSSQAKIFIEKIKDVWDKTDKGAKLKNLSSLHNDTILEQDEEGNWIIMLSKIETLKDFYRKLISSISEDLALPADQTIDLIMKQHNRFRTLGKEYPKIQKALSNIRRELTKELKLINND